MTILAVLLIWVLIGAILGLYEARRGHWHWIWFLYVVLGPFSLNLSRLITRNEQFSRPIELEVGSPAPHGGARILVGVDGSADALEAVSRAVEVFGVQLGAMTLAMVVEFEINEPVSGVTTDQEPWREECETVLREARSVVIDRTDLAPSTVLLSGNPADALRSYAENEEFDCIVVGSRGKGLSKLLLGSCATKLVKGSTVPTLVMPAMRGAGRTSHRHV